MRKTSFPSEHTKSKPSSRSASETTSPVASGTGSPVSSFFQGLLSRKKSSVSEDGSESSFGLFRKKTFPSTDETSPKMPRDSRERSNSHSPSPSQSLLVRKNSSVHNTLDEAQPGSVLWRKKSSLLSSEESCEGLNAGGKKKSSDVEMKKSGDFKERLEVIVGDEICSVPVVVSVKVKLTGYLQATDGDVVTLMAARNLPPGVLMCKNFAGEVGRLPMNAVMVSHHSWNLYLKVLPFLIESPELLVRIIQEELVSRAELVEMLQAKALLRSALEALLPLESSDVAFRENSPAMLLAGSLLSLPSLSLFKEKFVKFALELVTSSNSWEPSEVVEAIPDFLAFLTSIALEAPPVLVVFLQSIASVKNSLSVKSSIFFLRFVCPALAQPGKVLENEISEEACTRLLQFSKAVQLVANKVDPPEHSGLFPFAAKLKSNLSKVEDLLNKICNGLAVADVPNSVLRPAARLYSALCELHINDPEFLAIKMELGDPPSLDGSDYDLLIPPVARVKRLLETSEYTPQN